MVGLWGVAKANRHVVTLPRIESQSMVVQMNRYVYNARQTLDALRPPTEYRWTRRTQKQTTASWKTARPRGAPTRGRDLSRATNFTSLLVLVRTNLTLLRPPILLVVSSKQPTFATASAVQTILDEDDGLQSSQDYWSQTVRGSFLLPPIIFYPNLPQSLPPPQS